MKKKTQHGTQNLDQREIKEVKPDLVLIDPGQLNVIIKEEQDPEFTDQDPDFVDQQHCSSGVKRENQDNSDVMNYEQNFVNQDHIKREIKGETQGPDISDHNYHSRKINKQNRNKEHRNHAPTEPTDKQTCQSTLLISTPTSACSPIHTP
ncbi:uncharacterized protein LOC114868709 isoform X2 [Betta splendens]|uniref:Uncharacterized protein LOC114868709 isoform X2 n=1 Tax=Betta splendens TaxID=158456 RepID=A0A6P7PHI7_BETSP|nr:uncharacterized protein LOC114868709 isoform X2 [Betta splendens]